MKAREVGIVLRNMLLGGNLESLLALSNPRAAAYYVGECRFLYKCIFPKDGFVQRPVWEVFGADRVPVVLYGGVPGEWVHPIASYTADLVSMCMLCQILRPRTIFEIGTLRGASALHWAGNAPDADVYTLDLPPRSALTLAATEMDRHIVREHEETKHMAFDGKPEANRIHCLYGDSATFDFSPFFEKVDLLFIDGAHSYDYVRNDTHHAIRCCKPGSVIAWHDYGRVGLNGVSRYLHEFAGQGRTIYRVPGGSLAYARM
jgi:hypothetical protein